METPYSLFKIMHCISALRMKNIWYYWSSRIIRAYGLTIPL
jgi:hypothetical protein